MNNSKMRNIDSEVLEEALQELSPSFIEDLPLAPEELLKYAQRRKNPYISENISYNLGQSMLDHRLSDKEYLITFFKVINFVFSKKNSVQKPESQILLSQTGAGKTNLRALLLRKNPNTAIINSDQYKKFRPDVQQILEEDPTHFGALTGIDCYDHASNVIKFALENRYNILVECAPSITQGIIGVNLDELNECGYDTSFHVMAVGNLVSALAIHRRYELDLEREKMEGETKLTDYARHNESYRALEKIIPTLDQQKVSIYRRGKPSENYVPIMINEKLEEAREKSNFEYAFKGNEPQFVKDYSEILSKMKKRNAPESQFDQLMQIKDDYRLYIEDISNKRRLDVER